MFAAGVCCCAIAVHFRLHGFALPLVCPIPTHLLVHDGPFCLGKYTYSPLRISVLLPGGGDPWDVAMVTPLFAFCPHLLFACFAVNWYLPSILNIAYRQVK